MVETLDELLNRLLKETSNDPNGSRNGWVNVFASLVEHKLYDSFPVVFQKFFSLQPKWSQYHFDIIHMLLSSKYRRKIIPIFEDSLRHDSDNIILLYGLGLAFAASDHQDEAIETFKKAISIKKNFYVAHYNLGTAYYSKKNYKQALDSYTIALSDPDFAEPRLAIGLFYYNQGIFMPQYFEDFLQMASPYLDLYKESAKKTLKAMYDKLGVDSLADFYKVTKKDQ